MEEIARFLPAPVKSAYRSLRGSIFGIMYRGKSRYCPVCERHFRKFGDYGIESRTDAICLACGALERDRLTFLFLRDRTELFDGKARKMLHVAPEHIFVKRFSGALGKGYITADLNSPRAKVRMDICDIPFRDGMFDVIYCSHVLEHVYDDRKAMRELCRVLKKGGWAVLLVPVTGGTTVEDVSETDPAERLRRFGHEDHYRHYGRDFPDRLRSAGFEVKEVRREDICDEREIETMGLTMHAGCIYFCEKGKQ